MLADDNSDLAAAIRRSSSQDSMSGDSPSRTHSMRATVSVVIHDGLFDLQLQQHEMLRAAELYDGTLRFLLWTAALFSALALSLI